VKNQPYVQLTVSDTGQGIAPDILPNIFDPFFTTKTYNKGTGLGLSTVQGIVAGSGGAIIVETAPLHGTSIHLFFPSYESMQDRLSAIAS
jgi:signal transduction histidine kinase